MPKLKVGSRQCQCGGCGEYFNSSAAFDKHRVGPPSNRKCMTITEMMDKKMDKNTYGFWVSKRLPQDQIDRRSNLSSDQT